MPKLKYDILDRIDTLVKDKKDNTDNFKPKTRTKLSAQSTVMGALANTQPIGGGQSMQASGNTMGWGATS